MKTLPTQINTDKSASQSAWAELYDIYLKASITTPFGSTNTIRITNCGSSAIAFFTPEFFPEPDATQGDAANYSQWNIQRKQFKSASKDTNDSITITASNVTGEWADMLADVDWYDCYIVVRKVSLTQIESGSYTAADCVPIFAGTIDSVSITLEALSFQVSNQLAALRTTLPAEDMHVACRARWGDDLCGGMKFSPANVQDKTCGSGSTTTRVKSAGFTEDTYDPTATASVTADNTTEKITDTAHGLSDGDMVYFTAVAMPGGLTANTIYYIRDKGTNDYKLSATQMGSAINITSDGTTVVRYTVYGADIVNALSSGSITASSEQGSFEGYRVRAQEYTGTNAWKFALAGANPDPSVDFKSPYVQFDFGSAKTPIRFTIRLAASDPHINKARTFEIQYSADTTTWYSRAFTYATTNGKAGGVFNSTNNTYTLNMSNSVSARYWRITIRMSDGRPFVYDVCTTITAIESIGGGDLVNGSTVTASAEVGGFDADNVKSSNYPSTWRVNDTYNEEDFDFSDWGYNQEGYWAIPDEQAGLANTFLQPWIQFDFTSAKAAKVWRFKSMPNVERNEIPRTALIFSGSYFDKAVTSNSGTDLITLTNHGLSDGDIIRFRATTTMPTPLVAGTTYYVVNSTTNNFKVAATSGGSAIDITGSSSGLLLTANWKLEQYFELPPRPGVFCDVLIHGATSRRYWRVCVRNNWAESLNYTMFGQIQAYTQNRNYWANGGRIVFESDTTTAALQNYSAPVKASYSGFVDVGTLPAAPANGDTFKVYRGCSRLFNKCAELQNVASFAGFTTLPNETVIR